MKTDPTSPTSRLSGATPAGLFLQILGAPALLALLLLAASLWLAPSSAWAASFLERAQEYYDQDDLRSAAVELKNALQRDPENAEARLLLGRLYLDIEDGPSAEKELRRAVGLGLADDNTRLLLVHAHLMQQEYEEALESLPKVIPSEDEFKGAFLAARGQAKLGLGRFDEAVEDFEQALKVRPNPEAYEGLARKALIEGDFETAGRHIQEGLAIEPGDISLLALDAERSLREGDVDGAIAKFSRVVEAAPKNFLARARLARLHVRKKNYEAANAQLSEILARSPRSLEAKLLLGVIAFEQENYEEALSHSSQVLSINDRNLAALYVAGASSLMLDQLEKALSYLTQVTTATPNNEVARRLLATTQMRLGNSDAALASLTDDDSALKDDIDLRLVTDAALQSGNLQSGLRYLEDLAEKDRENAALRVRMGLLKIAMGDADDGAGDLQVARDLNPEVYSDPTFNQAESLLIETYLRTGQLENALAEAEKLQQNNPQSPDGHLYAGVALMALNRPEQGEQAFLKALEVTPGHPPASMGLSGFETQRGNFDAAQGYLESSLQRFPNNLSVMLRLAGLAERLGKDDQAKRWLERAVATHPEAIEPRISLSVYYLRNQEPAASLAIVSPLLPEHETNPVVLRYVGQAQTYAGRTEEAIATLKKWVALTPNFPQAHVALADAYERNGDVADMKRHLQEAVALDPNNTPVILRLGRLQIVSEDMDGARKTISQLMKAAPNSAAVKELEAGIAITEGKPQRAAELYREGRDIEDSARLVIGQAGAHWEADDREAAIATLEDWTARNPEDINVRFVTNRYYRELDRQDKLQANLEDILTFQPQNWVAHNNLAEMKAASGDLDEALVHAEKAFAAAPNHPGVKDTLGVILYKQGKTERAARLLRQAAAQLPDLPVVSYHLAQVLADSGETSEAQKLLNRILKQDSPFAERAEAEQLLQELVKTEN